MHNNVDDGYPTQAKVSLGARIYVPFLLFYYFLQDIPVIGFLVRPALVLFISFILSHIAATAAVGFEMCDPENHQMIVNILVAVSLPTVFVLGFKMSRKPAERLRF